MNQNETELKLGKRISPMNNYDHEAQHKYELNLGSYNPQAIDRYNTLSLTYNMFSCLLVTTARHVEINRLVIVKLLFTRW